jgi:adenylate cyclase
MLSVDHIRDCLEGGVPSLIATCDAEGMPNLTYVSQVHYVDPEHVALSFQFFNKTRENILRDPRATVRVANAETAAEYRLDVEYQRTESEGPLFERMKAKLAGVASHTGMAGVFRLLGADVYRVQGIEQLPSPALAPERPHPPLLPPLRRLGERIAACRALDELLDRTLEGLEAFFGIRHSMLLMLDESGRRLYTVASRGYGASGVGSEVALGHGVIGVAAEQRTPIRLSYASMDYIYGAAATGTAAEIPWPGLREPQSQLAVPIDSGGRLQGVLYVESLDEMAFCYEHEDVLAALAVTLGFAMQALAQDDGTEDEAPAAAAEEPAGKALQVRYYPEDDSVFLGEDYLIKGVAGAIFWKLLRDYQRDGRTEFSNRELRLDPSIPLPDIADNLEARLLLLHRRLQERSSLLGLEKTGRGRFRLCVRQPLKLVEVAA